MDPDHLQDTEWDLLEALWALEHATARQVAEHLEARRGWAYSTVKTLLDRMVKKELVVARQIGKVWHYSAAVERSKARRGAWARFVKIAFGGRVADALRFAADQSELTEQQREALAALLDREGEDR